MPRFPFILADKRRRAGRPLFGGELQRAIPGRLLRSRHNRLRRRRTAEQPDELATF
jgi:hypothetical protein